MPILPLLKKSDSRARLDELCGFAPREGPNEELVLWFLQLIAWMRPREGQSAQARVRFFEAQLAQHPEYRENVSLAAARLLSSVEVARLLAYGGIPLDFHFGGAVKEWLLNRALPAACKTDDGAQILRMAFEPDDLRWLGRREVIALCRALAPAETQSLSRDLDEAITVLATQIVAQAHAPSVRSLARAERSPYGGLCDAAAALVAEPGDAAAFGALRGRVRQCVLLLRSHRAELAERGADLNTTFQLARMRQQLDRLVLLGRLRHDPSDDALSRVAAGLVLDVTRSGSGRDLLSRSADLVLQNLVDSAATVGRSYLDEERSSWGAAFLAGAGGGALMALATFVKFWLQALRLPALYEGLAFSLNYASVFCVAYLLHATIATKLPSHTAAALARSAQQGSAHRGRLAAFLAVWRSATRLQLAGLVGNVVVAGPLAFLIDAGVAREWGRHLVSRASAEHALQANSLLGPSFIYAALTGVFLWMSSLLGALGDNWVRVQHLSDRLATNRRVLTGVGAARARAWADAVVDRAGGLLGNASLGFLLGGVPALFAMMHLPVEIRHVTVSTSSVALAFSAGVGTGSDGALAVLGVFVIGAVNVVVSFVLALWLALRATKRIRVSTSAHALVRIGLARWLRGRAAAARKPLSPAVSVQSAVP
jgi:site-specific recombinase